MGARRRDWVHCEGDSPAGATACGRSDREAPGALDKRPAREWEAVDCPTCRPIAHERARLEAIDAKRPEWLREVRKAKDAGPFLPVLCEALEARGIHADYARDVVTQRGFYVVAMCSSASEPTPVWLRFRRDVRDGEDTAVEIAWESPVGYEIPVLGVSADVEFIADALSARCKRKPAAGLPLREAKEAVLREMGRRLHLAPAPAPVKR